MVVTKSAVPSSYPKKIKQEIVEKHYISLRKYSYRRPITGEVLKIGRSLLESLPPF